jgi:hypothetical protein
MYWSLILTEEYRWNVSGKWLLGPKEKKLRGGLKKLHTEEVIRNFCQLFR